MDREIKVLVRFSFQCPSAEMKLWLVMGLDASSLALGVPAPVIFAPGCSSRAA